MHATVRRYSSRELADLLASRSDEVESLMAGIPGLHGYYLVRTDDGCMSITVCEDDSGTDESAQRAATWLRENASGISTISPDIAGGEVFAETRAAARA